MISQLHLFVNVFSRSWEPQQTCFADTLLTTRHCCHSRFKFHKNTPYQRSLILSTVLPKLPPVNMERKAASACSIPSKSVYLDLIFPSEIHFGIVARNSSMLSGVDVLIPEDKALNLDSAAENLRDVGDTILFFDRLVILRCLYSYSVNRWWYLRVSEKANVPFHS